MICSIYKGIKKQNTYIYIKKAANQKDDFSILPESLLQLMGKLELVMHLEINESTKLVQARAAEVLADIEENGFYLQMPDPDFKY